MSGNGKVVTLLFCLTLCQCSSDYYASQTRTLNAICEAGSRYVTGITDAHSKDEIIFSINNFTKQISRLHKKFLRLYDWYSKKNPEGKGFGSPGPEYLEAVKKLAEIDKKIDEAGRKVAGYAADPEVQEALIRLAGVMDF